MFLSAGERIGSYVLKHRLGVGGMAEVWAAEHAALGTMVALKLLPSAAPSLRARLLREGRAQAALRHPNILPVRDIIDVSGRPGLVLPLVEGPSLRQLLNGWRPSQSEACALFHAIASGVDFAHRSGLIHRDLKPGNVLLERRWGQLVPRIADFGLVKDVHGLSETRTGEVMGTLSYAAPEQLLDASSADQRADLFSLGAVLVELLTGRPPFRALSLGAILQAHEQGPDLDDLDEPWRSLCGRLLRQDPAERMPDCAALLSWWQEHVPVTEESPLGAGSPLAEAAARIWSAQLSVGTDESIAGTFDAPITEAPSHNLPEDRDAFVGREDALAELGGLLQGARLVTILGTAGCGKTRLAKHLARRHLASLPGGVWFCDLSEAHDLAGLCGAVARGADLPVGASPSPERLGLALASRGRCLVILDNFEQLTDFAEQTLGAWLAAAPEATLLVTSRAVLDLAGEQVFPLRPLSPEQAVALFTLRARQRDPRFEADGATLLTLAAVLDRLPLAIELAAGRVGTMGPEAIRDQLRERFRLLRSRRGSGRHATLEAAIGWSWELLEPWAQDALAQLSVFEGGFTLAAAEAVVDLSRWPDAPWLIDVLGYLLDRSLLVQRRHRKLAEPRFGMLLSIQDFAAAQRQADPERAACVQRHAAWFGRLGRQHLSIQRNSPEYTRHRRAHLIEQHNLIAAARRGEGVTMAVAAAEVLYTLEDCVPHPVLIEILRAALRSLEGLDEDDLRDHLKIGMARASYRMGAYERGLELGEEALAAARERGSWLLEIVALGLTAMILGHRFQRFDEAEARYRQSLAINTARGRLFGMASDHYGVATMHHFCGRLDDALAHYRASHDLYHRSGSDRGVCVALGELGSLYEMTGRIPEARAARLRCLAITKELPDYRLRGRSNRQYADLLRLEGELELARAHYNAALEIFRQLGEQRRVGSVLSCMARVSRALGEDTLAEAQSRRALRIAEDTHDVRGAVLERISLSALHIDQQRLSEAAALLSACEADCQRLGEDFIVGIFLMAQGALRREQGAIEESRGLLARSEAILRPGQNLEEIGALLHEQILLEIRAGALDAARHHLEEAQEIARELRLGPDAPLQQKIRRAEELGWGS